MKTGSYCTYVFDKGECPVVTMHSDSTLSIHDSFGLDGVSIRLHVDDARKLVQRLCDKLAALPQPMSEHGEAALHERMDRESEKTDRLLDDVNKASDFQRPMGVTESFQSRENHEPIL
jgi:hypothetical protein